MLEVRLVQASDVTAVLALITAVLAEFGLEFGKGSTTDDELRELPDSYTTRGGAFWIARRDGELLGTCGVFPLSPGTFELRKMYLLPESRGLGLGTRLLDEAVEWVRAQGGTRIVLDTVEEMSRAIAFYEAHGFVRDDGQVRGSRCTRGYTRTL
ncbi:MAG: GNAT family N-acetyltransferase [Deltaproteobacteria bacterium]|nr:GNAT family N-acetyltransferase [Deltaproteobacteria bacterium]